MLHVTAQKHRDAGQSGHTTRQQVSTFLGHSLLVLQEAQPKTTALHQAAWMLQIAALQLHRADMAVVSQRENARALLQTLFGAPAPDGGKPFPTVPFCCLHLSTRLAISMAAGLAGVAVLPAMHITPQPIAER